MQMIYYTRHTNDFFLTGVLLKCKDCNWVLFLSLMASDIADSLLPKLRLNIEVDVDLFMFSLASPVNDPFKKYEWSGSCSGRLNYFSIIRHRNFLSRSFHSRHPLRQQLVEQLDSCKSVFLPTLAPLHIL